MTGAITLRLREVVSGCFSTNSFTFTPWGHTLGFESLSTYCLGVSILKETYDKLRLFLLFDISFTQLRCFTIGLMILIEHRCFKMSSGVVEGVNDDMYRDRVRFEWLVFEFVGLWLFCTPDLF